MSALSTLSVATSATVRPYLSVLISPPAPTARTTKGTPETPGRLPVPAPRRRCRRAGSLSEHGRRPSALPGHQTVVKKPGRIPAFPHPVSRIRKYSRLPSICSRYIPTSTLWVGIPSFGCRKSPALSLPVTKERYASIQHGHGSWQGWHRSKPL